MEKILGHDELMNCLMLLGTLDPEDRQRVIRSICAFYPATEVSGQEGDSNGRD